MRLDSAFSDRLKWAIAAKNTNQAELARAIGISTQAVQQWASGATSNPNREHLLKACQHLGVRYDYLAYARGPMTDAQARAQAAPPAQIDPQTALLAQEWESRLSAALPHDQAAHLQVSLWQDGRRYVVPWLSDALGAAWGLYTASTQTVAAARVRLWTLAVARALAPPVPGRQWTLLLSPLEDGLPDPARTVEALSDEARLLHLDVALCDSPETAAARLTGLTQPAQAPEEDVLGLSVSSLM